MYRQLGDVLTFQNNNNLQLSVGSTGGQSYVPSTVIGLISTNFPVPKSTLTVNSVCGEKRNFSKCVLGPSGLHRLESNIQIILYWSLFSTRANSGFRLYLLDELHLKDGLRLQLSQIKLTHLLIIFLFIVKCQLYSIDAKKAIMDLRNYHRRYAS